MPADWIFVIALVLCALASGYALGVWRGNTLGYRHGRRTAWEEYTRRVGTPPTEPEAGPGHFGPPFVDDADFRSDVQE